MGNFLKTFKNLSILMLLAFAGYSTVFAQQPVTAPANNTRYIAFSNIGASSLNLMSAQVPSTGSHGRVILQYDAGTTNTADYAKLQLRGIMDAIRTFDFADPFTTANIVTAVNGRLVNLGYNNATVQCIKAFIGYGTNHSVIDLASNTQYAFAVLDYAYDSQNNQLKFWRPAAMNPWPYANNPRAVKTMANYTAPAIQITEVYATGFKVRITKGLEGNNNLVTAEYGFAIKDNQNNTTTVDLGTLTPDEVTAMLNQDLTIDGLTKNSPYGVALGAKEVGTSAVYNSDILYIVTTNAQTFDETFESGEGIAVSPSPVTSTNRTFRITLTFSTEMLLNQGLPGHVVSNVQTFRMNTNETHKPELTWQTSPELTPALNPATDLTLVSERWVDNKTYEFEYRVNDGKETDGTLQFGVNAYADAAAARQEVGHEALSESGDANKITFEMVAPTLTVEMGFKMTNLQNAEINDKTIRPGHNGVKFIFTFTEIIKLDGKTTDQVNALTDDQKTTLANNFMSVVAEDNPELAALITNLRDGNPATTARPTISLEDETGGTAHTVVTITWTFPKGSQGLTAAEIKKHIATLKDYKNEENELIGIPITLNNTLVADGHGNVMKPLEENNIPKFYIGRERPEVINVTITGLQTAGYANCEGEGATLAGYINENSTYDGEDEGFKVEIEFNKAMNNSLTDQIAKTKINLVKLNTENNGFTTIEKTTYITTPNTNEFLEWNPEKTKLTWTIKDLATQDVADYSNLYVKIENYFKVDGGNVTMLPTVTYNATENADTWDNILVSNGAMISVGKKPFRLDLIDEYVKHAAFNNFVSNQYIGVEPVELVIDNQENYLITTIYPKHESNAEQTLGLAFMLRQSGFVSLFDGENAITLKKLEATVDNTVWNDLTTNKSDYFTTGTPITSVANNELCRWGSNAYSDVKHPGLYIPINLGVEAKNADNADNEYRLTFEYTNDETGRAKEFQVYAQVDYTQPTITAIGVKAEGEEEVETDNKFINKDAITAAAPDPTITKTYLIKFDTKMNTATFTTDNLRLRVEDVQGNVINNPDYVSKGEITWDNDSKNARVKINFMRNSLEDINYHKIYLEVYNHESIKSFSGATLDRNYLYNTRVDDEDITSLLITKSIYIVDAVAPVVEGKPYNTDYEYTKDDGTAIYHCDIDVINSHRDPNDELRLTFLFNENVTVNGNPVEMLRIGLTGYLKDPNVTYFDANDDQIADIGDADYLCKKIVFTYAIGSETTQIALVEGTNNAIAVGYDDTGLNYIADEAGNKVNLNNPTLVRSIYYDVTPNTTENVIAVTNAGENIPPVTVEGVATHYISKECKVRFTVNTYNENDTYVVKLVESATKPDNPDVVEGEETTLDKDKVVRGVNPNENVLTTTQTLADMFPETVNGWEVGNKYYIVVKTIDIAKNKTVTASQEGYTVAAAPVFATAIKPPVYDANATTPQLANRIIKTIEFTVDTEVAMSTVAQANKKITFTPAMQGDPSAKTYTLTGSETIVYDPDTKKVTLTLGTSVDLVAYSSIFEVKIEEGAFVNILGSPMNEANWTIKTLPQLDVLSVEYVQSDGSSFEHNPANLRHIPTDDMYTTLGLKITFNQDITFSDNEVTVTAAGSNLYRKDPGTGTIGETAIPFVYTATNNDPTNVIILQANGDGDILEGMFTADSYDAEEGANLLIEGNSQYTPTLSDEGLVIAGGVELDFFPSFHSDLVVNQTVRVDAVKPVITKDFAATTPQLIKDDNSDPAVSRTFDIYTPEEIASLTVFKSGNNLNGFKIVDHNLSSTGISIWVRAALDENQASEDLKLTAFNYTNVTEREDLKFPALDEGGYFIRVKHTDNFTNTNDETAAEANYYFIVDANPVIASANATSIDMIQGNAASLNAVYAGNDTKEFRYKIDEQFLNIDTYHKGKTTLTFTKDNETYTRIVETEFTKIPGQIHKHTAAINADVNSADCADLYTSGGGVSDETLADFLNSLSAGTWNIKIEVTDKCGHTGMLANAMVMNVHSKPVVENYYINGIKLEFDNNSGKYVLPNVPPHNGKVGFTGNYIEFEFDKNIEDNDLSTFIANYPDFEYAINDKILKLTQKPASLFYSNTNYEFQLFADVVKVANAGIEIGNEASGTVLMTTDNAKMTGIYRMSSSTDPNDPGEYIQYGQTEAYFRITFDAAINANQMPDIALNGGLTYLATGINVDNPAKAFTNPNEVYIKITTIPPTIGTSGLIGIGSVTYNGTPYTLVTGATYQTYNVNRKELICTYSPTGTNVPVNSNIVLTFNETLAAGITAPTLTNNNVTLTAGTINYDNNTITYNVADNGHWAYNTNYTITVTDNNHKTVKDLWGNPCTVAEWSFETEDAPDVVYVTRLDPEDPYTNKDKVIFEVGLYGTTPPTLLPTIDDFSVIWAGTTSTITVTKVQKLDNYNTYYVTVEIPDNAKGELGVKYLNKTPQENQTYDVNRKPLTCTYFPTSDGTTSVSSEVRLTFTNEINAPANNPALTATYDNDQNTLALTGGTFNQAQNTITYGLSEVDYWAYNTNYTIKVGANNIVTDKWGNTCEVEAWSFKTEAAPVVESIVRKDPVDLFTNAEDVYFKVTFDKKPVFTLTTNDFTFNWNGNTTAAPISITSVENDTDPDNPDKDRTYIVKVNIPISRVGTLGLTYNSQPQGTNPNPNETYDVNRQTLVLTKSPGADAFNVPINTTQITLDYGRTLAGNTSAPVLKIQAGAGNLVDIPSGNVNNTDGIITYTLPVSIIPLEYGTVYTVSVGGQVLIADQWGNTNELENWSFTTVYQAPVVDLTDPNNVEGDVSVTLSEITVTFDKDITINNNSVNLTLTAGQTTIILNNPQNVAVSNKVATFTLPPGTVLAYGTEYTATLAAGSFTNNGVGNPEYEWKFTTEAAPVVESIVRKDLANQYTNEEFVYFTVEFNKAPAFVITAASGHFAPDWGVDPTPGVGSISNVVQNEDPKFYTVKVQILNGAVGLLGLEYTQQGQAAAPAPNEKYNVNRTPLTCSAKTPEGNGFEITTDEIVLTFNHILADAPGIPALTITNNATATGGTRATDYTITYTLSDLAYGTTYQVSAPSVSVIDKWGNTCTSITSWEFSTVAAPIANRIERTGGIDKFTNVDEVKFKVTFDKPHVPQAVIADFTPVWTGDGITDNDISVTNVEKDNDDLSNKTYIVTVKITDNSEVAKGELGLEYNNQISTVTPNPNHTYDINRIPLTCTPSPKGTGPFAVDSKIVLTFNNELAGVITNPTLEAKYGVDNNIPTALDAGTVNENRTTITYEVANNGYWAYGVQHNISVITNTVKDKWGNNCQPIQPWSFTTEAAPVITKLERVNDLGARPGEYTNKDVLRFKVTFDKQPKPALNTGNFTPTWTGTNTWTVGNVAAAGADNRVYTVTLSIDDPNKQAEGILGLDCIYSLKTGVTADKYNVNRTPFTCTYTPLDDATSVAVNQDLILDFDREIAPETTPPTLTTGSNTTLNGGVIASNNKKITYEVITNGGYWYYNTNYIIAISDNTVKDLWGNSWQPIQNWSFRTEAAPVITNLERVDDLGARPGMYTNKDVLKFKVTFDKQPKPALNTGNFTPTWTGTNTWTVDNVTPVTGADNKVYTVTLSINDPNKQAEGILGLNCTYNLAQNVIADNYNVNRTPFTCTYDPLDGTQDVKVDKALVLNFGRDLAPGTVRPTLEATNNATLNGGTLAGNTMTYKVISNGGYWAYNTNYTITISSNTVKDKWGNSWNPGPWSFRTESKPVIASIVRTNNADEYTHEASVYFTVTFNKQPKPAPTATDFGVTWNNGGTISIVDGAGEVYTVKVSGIPNTAKGILGLSSTYNITGTGNNRQTYNVNRNGLVYTVYTPTNEIADINADVVVTFNHELSPTANRPTVTVSNTTYSGTGTVSVNKITHTLPTLVYGTTYNVTVANPTVTDLWGNTCNIPTNWEFKIAARPAVTSYQPATTNDVPVNTPISVTFSPAVQLVGQNATVTLTKVNSGTTTDLKATEVTNGKLTFNLLNNLEYGTQYKLSIGANQVKRTDYPTITNAAADIVTFTTEAAPAAPYVTVTNPANGTQDVPITTNTVSVTFSENINIVSQQGAKVTIAGGGTSRTLTAYGVSGTNTLTFTLPSNYLVYGTQYTLSIADDQVESAATGINNVASANFSTFKTIAPPAVDVTNPLAGATSVSTNLTQITVTFTKAVVTANVNLTLSQGGTTVATITSATVNGSVATFAIPSTVTLDGNTPYTATLAENSFTASGLGNAAHTWNFTTGTAGPSVLLLTLSSTRSTITVSWPSQSGVNYTAKLFSDANHQTQVGTAANATGTGQDIEHTFTNLTRNTMYYVTVTSPNEEGEDSIATRKYKEAIISMNGIFEITEVTPMPINTDAQFSLATSKAGHLTVVIYGLAGEKLMDVLSIDLNAGDELVVPMSFANFASGTYTLVVRLDGEMIQRRIVINK